MKLEDLLKIVREAAAQPEGEDGTQPDPIAAGADALRNLDDTPDLAALESEAVAQFDEARNSDDVGPELVETLKSLADVADAVRTVASEHEQAREELAREVDALAARVNPTPDEESAGSGDDSDQNEATADEPAESGSDESDGSSSDEGGGEAELPTPAEITEQATNGGEAQSTDERELVAASAKNTTTRRPMPTVRQIQSQRAKKAQNVTASANRQTRRYTVTAAADVPRVPSGKDLTPEELANATINRFQAMPIGQANVGVQRNGIALIHREDPAERRIDGVDVMADASKIDAVADEKNLPGGSLTAAMQQNITAATSGPNGLFTYGDVYCIPAETDYTLCEAWATREGMLDLPTTTITNAGIRYPVWPQFPDQNANQFQPVTNVNYPEAPEDGWNSGNQTGLANPNYFVNNPKDRCIEMPCPEWVEQRMNLDYVCMTGDILKSKMWPQLVQRWISDAMTQQAHFMDALYIQDIVSRSDALTAYDVGARFQQEAGENQQGMSTFANGSLASGLLDHLLLVVAWFRNRYKMARGTTLDGFAPDWFRDMIKLDIEKKSNRPYGSVTNAEVDSLLASAGARVQWLYNYQPLGDGSAVGGRIMPPQGWPTEVELTLFPAGSWVLGQQDIITLDALYDSTQLQNNKFTQLFMEEGWMLLNRCNRSFKVTLTDICTNGAVGPNKDLCGGSGSGDASQVEVTNFPATQKVSVSNTPNVKVTNGTDSPVQTAVNGTVDANVTNESVDVHNYVNNGTDWVAEEPPAG